MKEVYLLWYHNWIDYIDALEGVFISKENALKVAKELVEFKKEFTDKRCKIKISTGKNDITNIDYGDNSWSIERVNVK